MEATGNSLYEKTAFCIGGEKYALDIQKLKDICLTSDKENMKEAEKIENYELDDELNMMQKVSVISREVHTAGNPQNDSIIYDMVKSFLNVLFESEVKSTDVFTELKFSETLIFNTLVSYGIIYKIEKQ